MQLSWLRPLFDTPGPYATVYLDATRASEDAAHEIDLRWRAAREKLTADGAPAALLDAMEKAALTPTGASGDHGLALVGAGERLLLARSLPGRPARETASWSPVPHLFPLVRAYAWTVPHVLVLVDRSGADISVYGPHGERLDDHTVEGKTWPLRKVPVGGWAHLRYQHKVENLWESNAETVAADIDRIVADTRAPLVLVGGDMRAMEKLESALGELAKAAYVRLETGGRAAGIDEEALDAAVERAVTERAIAAVTAVTGRFAEEQGRGGAAVDGHAPVVEALRRAQVETLLLQDDPSSTTTLWTSAEDPALVATTAVELTDLGVAAPVQDRADAVLLRALAGTDAGIVLTPQGGPQLTDGVGAVLRYADASTPS